MTSRLEQQNNYKYKKLVNDFYEYLQYK